MTISSFRKAAAALVCALSLPFATASTPPSTAASVTKATDSPVHWPLPLVATIAAPVIGEFNSTKQKNGSNKSDASTGSDSWVTIAGVLAAIVAAAIYAYQAFLMRQALVSQNRAFVFIKHFAAIPGVHADNAKQILFWRVVPTYENSGNTPTRQMRNYVDWTYFQNGVPEDFDFPDLAPTGIVDAAKMLAGPKQSLSGQAHDVAVHLVAAAKSGQGVILLWGWTEYRDIFSRTIQHRTEFCNLVCADGDPYTATCSFSFPLYKKHNNADQDCERKRGLPAPVRQNALPVPTP
jgi:hypothetical protein